MSLKQINTYKEESYINPKSSTIVYEFQYNISFRQLLHLGLRYGIFQHCMQSYRTVTTDLFTSL